MSDYFEYKYLALNTYYRYVCGEEYSHMQATGRCLVDYGILLEEGGVKALAIYSVVLVQFVTYVDELKIFRKEFEILINLYNKLPLSDLLSKNEINYLDDDIDYLKYKFKTI